jgi:DNA-binding transcriptional regulator YbjK
MFTCGLMETTAPRVVLKNTSASKFKAVLSYIYTGQMHLTNLSEAAAKEYLALAHMYQLDELVSSIATSLEQDLSVDNVVHRYATADLYGLGKLKAACLKFMDDNASAVLQTLACLRLSKVLIQIVHFCVSCLRLLIGYGNRIQVQMCHQ